MEVDELIKIIPHKHRRWTVLLLKNSQSTNPKRLKVCAEVIIELMSILNGNLTKDCQQFAYHLFFSTHLSIFNIDFFMVLWPFCPFLVSLKHRFEL